MAPSQHVNSIQVEDYVFPSIINPPGSDNTFFLGGAGERGRSDIVGYYVKYTAIAVYLEEGTTIPALADKWKGKTATELAESAEFIRDVITGPFGKFIQVTMIQPLTGEQYSVNMAKMFVEHWTSMGVHTDEAAVAIQGYLDAFQGKKFSPGQSILFTLTPDGKFTIAFSEHSSIPENGEAVLQGKLLPQEIMNAIIGENGVCPAARRSLADRMSALLDDKMVDGQKNCGNQELSEAAQDI